MALIAHLTDIEFADLVGESPIAFATRLRDEETAMYFRDRIAAVAADLRHWIATGEVSDPVPVTRIAEDFDDLARALEREAGRPLPVRPYDGSDTRDNVTVLMARQA